MKRLRPVSRKPQAASDVAPEVKLAYLQDLIEISIPLFENKDPSNPAPSS